MLVVLFWSGLAWTQAQAPNDGAERIMVVHENGKSTRCRTYQKLKPMTAAWRACCSRSANERITIVDDASASNAPPHTHGTPKRIFAWGVGVETPPEGSPLPPQAHHDSKVQIAQSTLASTAPKGRNRR